jgi:hypothetical protein
LEISCPQSARIGNTFYALRGNETCLDASF